MPNPVNPPRAIDAVVTQLALQPIFEQLLANDSRNPSDESRTLAAAIVRSISGVNDFEAKGQKPG